jgi:hypothetical protein
MSQRNQKQHRDHNDKDKHDEVIENRDRKMQNSIVSLIMSMTS